MKAAVLEGIGNLVYRDYQDPKLNKDDVLLKVRYCGVCGSDIQRILISGTYLFPIIPGHEFMGTVVSVGCKENNSS